METLKVLILFSMAVNYPILNDMGYGFTMIPAICVDKANMQKVLDLLGCTKFVDEFMTLKQADYIFEMANSEFVVHICTGTSRSDKMISLLSAKFKSRQLGALPLIITNQSTCDEFTDDLFIVDIDCLNDEWSVPFEKFIPTGRELSLIAELIESRTDGKWDTDVLRAAVCFMYPRMRELGMLSVYTELEELVDILYEQHENSSRGCMAEEFVNVLYSYEDSSNLYNLEELKVEITDPQNVILYSTDFVYIGERIFKKICEPLLKVFSINSIKKTLACNDVLVMSAKNTYSVKVTIYNYAGVSRRVRMLKLRRSKLYKTGEVDFVDYLLIGGRGHEN